MSTRCNVVIRDRHNSKLCFYRHSDGYPEGTLPTLREFMELVKKGTIRRNVEQSAGWLILIGAREYNTFSPNTPIEPNTWKCGAYEPCVPSIENEQTPNDDIQFLYFLDLEKLTITITNLREGLRDSPHTFHI